MPICPNCGSYILLGNHSCDCGTTISDDFEEDYEGGRPLRPKDENPYRYDFLNDLYHDYFDILPLEQMDKDIAEIEEKYSAKFKDYNYSSQIFYLNFFVEAKYFDAIIRASYDSSYAYNDFELIRDIVTPHLTKLYSSEEFKQLVQKTEKEIDSKFMHCSLGFIGDELTISVFFEGLKTFFLNGNDLIFRD